MTKPTISPQELRARIGHRAKSAPKHRFWGLYVHVLKPDVLEAAYLEAKRNGGAPGQDGITFEHIEEEGRAGFLGAVAEELRTGTYRCGYRIFGSGEKRASANASLHAQSSRWGPKNAGDGRGGGG